MTDKTKTIVVIEHHEQTIIHHSRAARPSGSASSDAVVLEANVPLDPGAPPDNRVASLRRWLKAFAQRNARDRY